MDVTIVHPGDPAWNGTVDRIGQLLGAPDNPRLFPYHFLQATLPRLGGRLIIASANHLPVGAGCVLPRPTADAREGERAYTLRFHPTAVLGDDDRNMLVAKVANLLQGATIVYYDPRCSHDYAPTYQDYGAVNIGRPNAAEAEYVRALHQRIWGSATEYLYPVDIHSTSFQLATSLVARVDGQTAGFLFGFYKYGGPGLPFDWHSRFGGYRRLESQTMGVAPSFRGMRIGFLLKRAQAESAVSEGIGIVNWTTDPLLYANAALNFGLLRAIAFDYYTDLYPFRNELNRVHASRIGLTWLIGTRRVREVALYDAKPMIVNLDLSQEIPRVNRGTTTVNFTLNAPLIAIEIPVDWTRLQQEALPEARAWRDAADRIFRHYIGLEPGKYVITDVGRAGERCFLVGQQVGRGLWQSLGLR